MDETDGAMGEDWCLYCGDSGLLLGDLPAACVDLALYSPPFSSLYTYSASERDLGNCRSDAEFFEHYGFVSRQLLRLVKPGRHCIVHVMDLPTTKAAHGVIELRDFSGMMIRHHQAEGWHYHGRVTCDTNPQAQAIRTRSKSLLFVQKNKDRSWLRPALPQYLLIFRRPGENAVPIRDQDVSNEDWIEWAHPVWYGIRETHTLNVAEARGDSDERHICPLSLDIIARCVRLWSNAGETVLSPFAGIGSEGVGSLRCGRRFLGVELNPNYWQTAVKNLREAEVAGRRPTLFDALETVP